MATAVGNPLLLPAAGYWAAAVALSGLGAATCCGCWHQREALLELRDGKVRRVSHTHTLDPPLNAHLAD